MTFDVHFIGFTENTFGVVITRRRFVSISKLFCYSIVTTEFSCFDTTLTIVKFAFKMAKAPAVGISLGTTNSCVGIFRDGKISIILNDKGNLKTPSIVAFTDTKRLIGDDAMSQMTDNPLNTIFNVKRLIGRKFNDPVVQNDMQYWPFIVKSFDSKPKVEVEYKGEIKQFFPEEISAMILSKMKETAEYYLKQPVTDAVISVPANFNDSQRQATKDAGTISGLNVLQIINEPTAAAMAYVNGLDKKDVGKLNVLIIDFGGGKIDVSIVEIVMEEKSISVLFTAGNTHLGGKDIDDCLIKYITEKYEVDFNQDKKVCLRKTIEKAKENCPKNSTDYVNISFGFNGKNYMDKICQTDFENIIKSVLCKLTKLVKEAKVHAETESININDIIMVGGLSQFPLFEKIVKEEFLDKEIHIINEELVCQGASIQAAFLQGETSIPEYFRPEDITPFPLVVLMSKYDKNIKRFEKIPYHEARRLTFLKEKSINIHVFEGEEQSLLGEFKLSEFVPNTVDVNFDIDKNGIFKITAITQIDGQYHSAVKVTSEKGRLSTEDIVRIQEKVNRKKDLKAAEQFFRSHCSLLKKNARNILTECGKFEGLLKSSKIESKETYKQYRTDLESKCKTFIINLCDAASVHTGASSRSSSAMSIGRPPLQVSFGSDGENENKCIIVNDSNIKAN
ncbi:heat shock 70 kDa protein II-like isoform X2 [Contarinia nasturtii]|uniref:heat shock 70 kDa protein II-like isoform X2 n=1 Tax=Contarinia nasturtii TaxID=265458 RepID=UPI0012D3FA60|nr:heat shock 70 kDa protein II-like isoform X2 [Contarinia nasturtii]